ncbi:aspartyl/asparaginyl beta-hydroxylase domain-containing protein [Nocardia salmonicida]|uniref:aspartyl/asparaginyl beta-hydroxylase domain-containing protein n=1 Tax=Nocardia salmonicida TaxID=53431 RepID=UPI0033DC0D62
MRVVVDLGYGFSRAAMGIVEYLGNRDGHARPVLTPRSRIPWIAELETDAGAIATEYRTLIEAIAPANSTAINPLSVGIDGAWSLMPLIDRAGPYPWLARCAVTARALARIPRLRAADFAVLAPQSHIHPHVGHNWGVMRAHLALIVPARPATCELRFPDDDLTVAWTVGVGFAFDDTRRHEAQNLAETERVVLLIEFDRELPPGLAALNAVSQWLYRWHPVQRGVRRRILVTDTSAPTARAGVGRLISTVRRTRERPSDGRQ